MVNYVVPSKHQNYICTKQTNAPAPASCTATPNNMLSSTSQSTLFSRLQSRPHQLGCKYFQIVVQSSLSSIAMLMHATYIAVLVGRSAVQYGRPPLKHAQQKGFLSNVNRSATKGGTTRHGRLSVASLQSPSKRTPNFLQGFVAPFSQATAGLDGESCPRKVAEATRPPRGKTTQQPIGLSEAFV